MRFDTYSAACQAAIFPYKFSLAITRNAKTHRMDDSRKT